MKPAAPSPSRHHANVRASAARAISRVLRGNSLDDALLPADRFRLPADAAMARLLAYGVLRDLRLLQAIAGKLVDKPLAQDDEIHALLLTGLYQLRTLTTPPHAAINETVAAADVLKRAQAQGFVNAVLRRYTREQAPIEAQLANDAGVRHSHPDWLVQRLRTDWPRHWESLLAANNTQGPLTLRVNRRRMSRDEYARRLAGMGIAARTDSAARESVTLAEARAVEKIPGFNGGQVSVQDASAQLATPLLRLDDGLRVLDACAAPGGKTSHMLESADVDVTAVDRDAQRLIRVDENLRRLKLSAKLVAGDAGEPLRWWDGKPFDRVLLDAPCSGTGVIRRHPDIKWLRRESDIAGLQAQQLRLLKSCWGMLKPGGRLVYATCSVLQAEGDEIIARFRQLADHVVVEPIAADWGEATAHGRRLAPGGAYDGFYYASLLKR
ncbi:MAG: 16S rRNA (cytosine(967)-C(5))-methyltransferase RsmB [Solimonas sp.]